MPLFMIQDSDRPMWLVAADWSVALAQWKAHVASENDDDDAEPDGIQLVCPDDELLIYGHAPYSASSATETEPDGDKDAEIDLDAPETLTPVTHYKTIKNGDPICLGFYKASMEASEVDCEKCLRVIEQRRNMDMGDWLK